MEIAAPATVMWNCPFSPPQSLWDWLFFWKKVPDKIPIELSQFRILNPEIVREAALDLLHLPEPQPRLWGWDQVRQPLFDPPPDLGFGKLNVIKVNIYGETMQVSFTWVCTQGPIETMQVGAPFSALSKSNTLAC